MQGGGPGTARRLGFSFISAERHEPEQAATNVARRLVGLTAAVAVLAAVLAAGAGVREATHTSRAPTLLTEGIAADPCAPQDVIIVPAHRDVRYDGDSSALRTGSGTSAAGAGGPGGPGGSAPASGCTSACVAAGRGWLAAGTVPGTNPATRSMAQRALLDLDLSTRPDGAVVAGWYPGWDYASAARLELGGGGARGHRPRRGRLPRADVPGAGAEPGRHVGGAVPARQRRCGPRRPPGGTGHGRLGAVGGLVLVRGRPTRRVMSWARSGRWSARRPARPSGRSPRAACPPPPPTTGSTARR